MHVHINHCWCHDSIWGGHYNCRVIVGLKKYACLKDIYANKPMADWANLLDELPFDNSGEEKKFIFNNTTYRLKPEVRQWLEENIKDRAHFQEPKGWAVGSDAYNARDRLGFSLFFQSTRDALAFVKRWSVDQKPTTYFNYFHDIRRELNPKTGRLSKVAEFKRD